MDYIQIYILFVSLTRSLLPYDVQTNHYNEAGPLNARILPSYMTNYFFEIFIVNFTYKFSNFIHISFLIVLLDISLFYQNQDKLSTHTKNFCQIIPTQPVPAVSWSRSYTYHFPYKTVVLRVWIYLPVPHTLLLDCHRADYMSLQILSPEAVPASCSPVSVFSAKHGAQYMRAYLPQALPGCCLHAVCTVSLAHL